MPAKTNETPKVEDTLTQPAPVSGSRQSYQMDLSGIIEVLSRNLYSQGPDVVIRELLQNAVDAISARLEIDPDLKGDILLEIHPSDDGGAVLSIGDNGLGIAHTEIEKFLGTIAFSAKRDELADLLGQFGVGLLSCYLVADSIELISIQDKEGAEPFKWTGHRDGYWQVDPIQKKVSPGTQIFLKLQPVIAQKFTFEHVTKLASRFGEFLPVDITVKSGGEETKVRRSPAWSANLTEEQLLSEGNRLLGGEFVAAFPFQCPELESRGVAFISSERSAPGSESLHRLYVKGMFVSDHARGLGPVLAPYVQCVVNSNSLRVNVAREDLHGEESRLDLLRDSVNEGLRTCIEEMAAHDPIRLGLVLAAHMQCLMAEASATGAYLSMLRRSYVVSTTLGRLTIDEAIQRHGRILFATNDAEYARIEIKAAQEGICVVQGYFSPDRDLLILLEQQLGKEFIKRTSATDFLSTFRSEQAIVGPREEAFLRIANAELQTDACRVRLEEAEDPYSAATLEMEDMDSILRAFDSSEDLCDRVSTFAKSLCLNRDHHLVEQLVSTPDQPDDLRRAWVRVFYHEALLSAREHPTNGEIRRLNRARSVIWKATCDVTSF